MEGFDFERLLVYQKIRRLNAKLLPILFKEKEVDKYLRDQLKRASLSVAFNLAEGVGRVTAADKKRFYTIARSSVYECVAILHTLFDLGTFAEGEYHQFYSLYTEISKMLYALYRKT
jgi:four helix bundle protein